MDKENRNLEQMVTKIHHGMAVVGGFIGGYAILTRGDFLGNAQTANLIYLMFALLGRDLPHILLRILALCMYVLGTMSYVMVKNKTDWDIRMVSLGVDFAAVVVVGFIPATVDPVAALLPIFFAMSLQWNAFPGNYGYASSTIFSTNNVKQTTLAFSEYLCDKDKKHLHKMKFFLGSLIGFHAGVILSYLCKQLLGEKSIWLCTIALLIVGVMVKHESAARTKAQHEKPLDENLNIGYVKAKGIS